jgi:hypothetical protein
MAAAETIRRTTHLVGPPLAGLLIALIGPTAVIWLDVVSFAISAALVVVLVPIIRAAVDGDMAHWFSRVREGFAFLFGDPLLRTLILIIGAVNILMNPIFLVVLPVYASTTTGSPTDLGLLIGAFGVGSVISAISFGALAERISRAMVLRIGLVVTGMPVWVLATVPPVLGRPAGDVRHRPVRRRDRAARAHRARGAHPGDAARPGLRDLRHARERSDPVRRAHHRASCSSGCRSGWRSASSPRCTRSSRSPRSRS